MKITGEGEGGGRRGELAEGLGHLTYRRKKGVADVWKMEVDGGWMELSFWCGILSIHLELHFYTSELTAEPAFCKEKHG